MKKYAKLINEETQEVSVGLGTNAQFYESLGMQEMDVEQAYDGLWYIEGYAPQKSEEQKQSEVRAIRNQYLEKYVDPYQLVIRWNSLSDEDQNNIINYRDYLLNYTEEEDWWEHNPLTYDEWIESQEESS